jgi:hypothetical protein
MPVNLLAMRNKWKKANFAVGGKVLTRSCLARLREFVNRCRRTCPSSQSQFPQRVDGKGDSPYRPTENGLIKDNG